MNLDANFWWFGLRACLYCGSLFPQTDGLCAHCSQELWSWVPDEELHLQEVAITLKARPPSTLSSSLRPKTLPAVSLFQWIPGEQQVLSRLILALKGDQAGRLWRRFAQEFWNRHLSSVEPLRQPVLLIPSPARHGQKDHASLFTNALAELCHAEVVSCLKRQGSNAQAQKKKSRSQRSRVDFEWGENFSPVEFRQRRQGKKVVFVDDVVTSGATAEAAWRRLGQPEDFTIWSLAQRSLSCGASTDLV